LPVILPEIFTRRRRQASFVKREFGYIKEGVMKYAVVIEKGADNYSAYVPDLPGCVAAADTIEETERLIQSAIEFHIRGMIEDGIEIPKPVSLAREIEIRQPA
jgi:predicted RNase H-like HicB family nuclease